MEALNRDCSLSSQLTRLSAQLGHPIGRSCLDKARACPGAQKWVLGLLSGRNIFICLDCLDAALIFVMPKDGENPWCQIWWLVR